ncbi:MAG: hypothetical protein AAF485_08585 [Chloroflexota bacterium]
MIHLTDVEKFDGTLQALAEDLGDLRYDTLTQFLNLLAEKLAHDAKKDQARQRDQLATALHSCSEKIEAAAADMDQAWKICKPYMQ